MSDFNENEVIDEHLQFRGGATFKDGAVSTEDLDIGSADFVASGDFVGIGPAFQARGRQQSTSSQTYSKIVESTFGVRVVWDDWVPSGAQAAVAMHGTTTNAGGSVKIENQIDNEVVVEQTGLSTGDDVRQTATYTPTTTSDQIFLVLFLRSADGSTFNLFDFHIELGVQL